MITLTTGSDPNLNYLRKREPAGSQLHLAESNLHSKEAYLGELTQNHYTRDPIRQQVQIGIDLTVAALKLPPYTIFSEVGSAFYSGGYVELGTTHKEPPNTKTSLLSKAHTVHAQALQVRGVRPANQVGMWFSHRPN